VQSSGLKQVEEVRSGGSFLSQNDMRLHFGLGSGTTAAITVRWANGKTENIPSVSANQAITIREGRGVIAHSPLSHVE
jgi:hypothetical protein